MCGAWRRTALSAARAAPTRLLRAPRLVMPQRVVRIAVVKRGAACCCCACTRSATWWCNVVALLLLVRRIEIAHSRHVVGQSVQSVQSVVRWSGKLDSEDARACVSVSAPRRLVSLCCCCCCLAHLALSRAALASSSSSCAGAAQTSQIESMCCVRVSLPTHQRGWFGEMLYVVYIAIADGDSRTKARANQRPERTEHTSASRCATLIEGIASSDAQYSLNQTNSGVLNVRVARDAIHGVFYTTLSLVHFTQRGVAPKPRFCHYHYPKRENEEERKPVTLDASRALQCLCQCSHTLLSRSSHVVPRRLERAYNHEVRHQQPRSAITYLFVLLFACSCSLSLSLRVDCSCLVRIEFGLESHTRVLARAIDETL